MQVETQHAAHERINLDSYLQQLAEDPHLVIQTTAVKKKECKLTATQCQTAWRLKELLEYWGYHISINGIKQLQIEVLVERGYHLQTVPSMMDLQQRKMIL